MLNLFVFLLKSINKNELYFCYLAPSISNICLVLILTNLTLLVLYHAFIFPQNSHIKTCVCKYT